MGLVFSGGSELSTRPRFGKRGRLDADTVVIWTVKELQRGRALESAEGLMTLGGVHGPLAGFNGAALWKARKAFAAAPSCD